LRIENGQLQMGFTFYDNHENTRARTPLMNDVHQSTKELKYQGTTSSTKALHRAPRHYIEHQGSKLRTFAPQIKKN
jgi:hypothetical protein